MEETSSEHSEKRKLQDEQSNVESESEQPERKKHVPSAPEEVTKDVIITATMVT